MSRDQNRLMFPKFAEIMDAMRELYPTARVIYVEEDGRTVGKLPEPDEYEIEADGLLRIIANDRRADALNAANPRRSILGPRR